MYEEGISEGIKKLQERLTEMYFVIYVPFINYVYILLFQKKCKKE